MVYKVKDIALNRFLIVKESVQQFEEDSLEGTILKECFHPAIPVLIEYFQENNRIYLIMEYVEGITLAEYMEEKGALEQQLVLELGRQLIEVIGYLHIRQPIVVYGDIKPENIIITSEGNLRLIDFGSAFYLGEQKHKISGTPGYAAPELAQNGEADERSDIYSMGCLLHYMITGENPCKPPYLRRPLEECGIVIDKNVQKFINKSISTKPNDRFQDVKTFQEAFRCMERPYRQSDIMKAGFRIIELLCWCLASIYIFINSRNLTIKDFLVGNWKWEMPCIFVFLCILCYILAAKKESKTRRYYMQKNLWKTEKKGIGLFILLFILGMTGITVNAQVNKKTDIPIQLYSEKGYKVCIRKGESLSLKGALRMEIPREYLEGEGQREIFIIVKNPITREEEKGMFKILLEEE